MRIKSNAKKKCICFLSFLFLFVFSPAILFSQEPQSQFDKVYDLELPEEIGSVEQRWKGEKDQMLILIQDSHISLEVQMNIAKIIQLLVNDYDVGLVNIEGADHEKINFQELRDLEPKDVVERVSVDFLKESRINGAVYAKINNPKDFIEYGTEDKNLYLDNYKFYLKVMENNTEVLSQVIDIKNELLKNKEKFISKKLIEFINLEILFRDGDTKLVSYFQRIVKYAKKTGIELIEYPMVYKLLEMAFNTKDKENLFKSVDSKVLLDELAALAQEIKNRMCDTPQSKDFVELLSRLVTLEEFLKLRVLQTDYEIYKKAPSRYEMDSLVALINTLMPERDTQFLNKLQPLLADANQFYEVAHKRSEVLFRNSLENMKTENKNISVAVSGGYHTEALVELCRAEGISYLRVMPQVTTDEVTVDYEGRMLQLKSELLPDSASSAVPAAGVAPEVK